jgi:peptidoglycan/LPS O-acetylase OafA/YrhL
MTTVRPKATAVKLGLGAAVGSATPTAPHHSDRVLIIDGLRGLAALLVVLYHLHGAISRTASDWLWAPLDVIARNGFLGVDIFFVISGFVIALSVSKGAPTFGYFGRFIMRRSIRLDPPYWSSILLELLLLYVSVRLFTDITAVVPSTRQLIAHLFYAQEILGYGSVVNVYWTLCYEIQFYGFFVAMVVLGSKLPSAFRRPGWTALFTAALFGLSLWTRYWRPEGLPNGIAIDRWFQFFIGALTYRAILGQGRLKPLVFAWAALAITVLAARGSVTQFLPILVSAWLVLCVRDPRWGRLFVSRPLKFLGLISYSIYLYHSTVGWRFVSLVQRLLPGPWSAPTALATFLAGIVFSVAFSAALWWLIERPCLRLCQRVRLPRRDATVEPSRVINDQTSKVVAAENSRVVPATS